MDADPPAQGSNLHAETHQPSLDTQPDMQICRIRLSDKTSRLHPRRAPTKRKVTRSTRPANASVVLPVAVCAIAA